MEQWQIYLLIAFIVAFLVFLINFACDTVFRALIDVQKALEESTKELRAINFDLEEKLKKIRRRGINLGSDAETK